MLTGGLMPVFDHLYEKKKKDNFVQEHAYIEEPMPLIKPDEEEKKDSESGIIIIELI